MIPLQLVKCIHAIIRMWYLKAFHPLFKEGTFAGSALQSSLWFKYYLLTVLTRKALLFIEMIIEMFIDSPLLEATAEVV